MSRHKLKDLGAKLKIGDKPARIGKTRQEDSKPSLRAVSKLAPVLTKQVKHEDDFDSGSQVLDVSRDDEHSHGQSYINANVSDEAVPSLISADHDSTSVTGPRLTDESIRDFLKPDKKGKRDDDNESLSIKTAGRGTTRSSRRTDYEEDFEEDFESILSTQDDIRPSRQNRPSSATGRVRRSPDEIAAESVPKQSIVRLIKSSNLQSAGAELVDGVRELMLEFTRTVLQQCADEKRLVNAQALHRFMATYIPNEETDLNEDIVLSSPHFERLIRPICEEFGYIIKRDTFYLLHLFVETIMVKILQGSDMVADAANRKRVCAKDVLVAYSIYMM